jgi:acetyl esterase/lipase
MPPTTSLVSGVSGEMPPPPHVVEDCLGLVQLLSDGTVKRAQAPLVLPDDAPPVPSADAPAAVRWKDVVYDETHHLSLRVYVPPSAAGGNKKLPVLVYFHGGGFCIGSFAMPDFHAACLRLAAELPAVVLSADYRLAPEHRLPAALDDAESLFAWLRAQAAAGASVDPWLAEFADFGRVFVSGDSAGANIAHHVAVRVGSGRFAADPAIIAGCILLCPYFGGERRTASEASCPADVFLTLPLYDQMWRLALPAGATRDHPLANPFGPGSPALDSAAHPPVLVAAGDRDMLVDRIRDYVARLNAGGKKRAELAEFPGQGHGFSIFEPDGEAADELLRVVLRRFVHGGAAAPAS